MLYLIILFILFLFLFVRFRESNQAHLSGILGPMCEFLGHLSGFYVSTEKNSLLKAPRIYSSYTQFCYKRAKGVIRTIGDVFLFLLFLPISLILIWAFEAQVRAKSPNLFTGLISPLVLSIIPYFN